MFTLHPWWELLVGITIIAVLIGLLLPAVQEVRERWRLASARYSPPEARELQ